MQIKRPLLILAGGFVLGEVLGLQNEVACRVMSVTMLTAGVLAAAFVVAVCRADGRCNAMNWIFRRFREVVGRSLWLWLLPVFLCAGFWRASDARKNCERELHLALDETQVTVLGTVLSRNKREDDSYVIILGDCEGEDFELGKMQVYLDETCRIGTRILVSGTIQEFDEARNPGEFDYRLYARSKELNYRMFADNCRIVDEGYQRIRENVAQFREWAGSILDQLAEPKDCGVYRAAILGDSSQMDKELYELYQDQGVAHLLAVSGLHLSLISAAVYGSLRKLGLGYGAAGMAGGMVLMLYAVLTGESPSVLRALIMGLCGFAASYCGRTYDLMSAWSLALVLLLWDSPYRLLQAGVQLSFGALAGIGWLAPALMNLAQTNTKRISVDKSGRGNKKVTALYQQIEQSLVVSISMQLVTLPILLYHYFQYPTYGILINFLMVPLMGGVVASGTAGIICGSFSLICGRFALGCGHMILAWYEFCCHAAARLPGNVLNVGRPEWWSIGIYYGMMISLTVILLRDDNIFPDGRFWKKRAAIFLLCFCATMMMIRLPSGHLNVTFLDVGQGDGICIQAGGKTILVDGGSTDQRELGKYRLVPFLHSQGIHELDYAIVSHGDLDHISGFQYLMENDEVKVRNLILPSPGRGEEVYEELEILAKNNGSKVHWLSRGDRIKIVSSLWKKELCFTCLSPNKNIKTEDRNEHSLVLKVDYGDFHMLLTGDMTEKNEEEILSVYRKETFSDIQVLKAAHHGSATSSGEEWLQAIDPQWAVISYGENNRYGHPDDKVVARLRENGAKIYETAKSGAVMLETDGRRIWWQAYLK